MLSEIFFTSSAKVQPKKNISYSGPENPNFARAQDPHSFSSSVLNTYEIFKIKKVDESESREIILFYGKSRTLK